MSDQSIRPRTAEERKAFLQGYAAAVNDVSDHDLRFAAEWLATSAVADGIVTQEQADEARRRRKVGEGREAA